MGCGSSNSTVPIVTSDVSGTKQGVQTSKASPKPSLMKADKFLSREEARERRQKMLEEKQGRSQNSARAISAQALVDQERLSTSTRRSVRSFASSSTATPLKPTEPSTQELLHQEGTDYQENVHISPAVEASRQAPEVIVEESKSILSSENKEGRSNSLAKDGGLEQGERGSKHEEEGAKQSGLKCQEDVKSGLKSVEAEVVGTSRLTFDSSQKDEGRYGEDAEERTVANENLHDDNVNSKELSKQSFSYENNEEIVSTIENNPEVVKNATQTDGLSRSQTSNHADEEPPEEGDGPVSQDVDEGSIMDIKEVGVEGKVQRRPGIQGEAWDGSDEGVADLDDVEDEVESEVHGEGS